MLIKQRNPLTPYVGFRKLVWNGHWFSLADRSMVVATAVHSDAQLLGWPELTQGEVLFEIRTQGYNTEHRFLNTLCLQCTYESLCKMMTVTNHTFGMTAFLTTASESRRTISQAMSWYCTVRPSQLRLTCNRLERTISSTDRPSVRMSVCMFRHVSPFASCLCFFICLSARPSIVSMSMFTRR